MVCKEKAHRDFIAILWKDLYSDLRDQDKMGVRDSDEKEDFLGCFWNVCLC